ncbi:MAG: hypothetical protein LBT43_08910 [Prevotella sp.]|nr:hypothetical protein [Prevotella sp.]
MNRIVIYGNYNNLELNGIDVSIKLSSSSANENLKDTITISARLKNYITDSININYGRNSFIVVDTTTNPGYRSFDIKKLQNPLNRSEAFQRKISGYIKTNNKSLDINMFVFGDTVGQVDPYDLSVRRKLNHAIDSLKTFNLGEKYNDTIIFPLTSNLYTCVSVKEKRQMPGISYDYYLRYNKDIPAIKHQTLITGTFLKEDIKGDIYSIIELSLKCDSLGIIDRLAETENIRIHFSSRYIILQDLNIYPAPDKISHTTFEYTNPILIKDVLANGIVIKGYRQQQKDYYNLLNWIITFSLATFITILITYIIDKIKDFDNRRIEE